MNKQSRRHFIQKIGATATLMPLITPLDLFADAVDKQNDQPMLRVALMGLGSYASRVAKAMQACKFAKITGLISGTPEKLRDWGTTYQVPEKNRYNYTNFDQIKSNPDIDAVYILTPNALHHSQTIRVANAGKHVICEKPMAVSVQESIEMIDACKKANVHLLIGYRMHFEPKTLEIHRMRASGELGKILFFQGQCGFRIGNPDQWRLNKELAGGGSLMDIGIYAVNGARYMVGEEPIWVTAQEIKTNPEKFKAGVDETILFQLGFPSGAVASCLSTYNMNFLDRFYLTGERGFAELQPATGYGPIQGRSSKGPLTQPHTEHQTLQMDEMAQIILNERKPTIAVDGHEGLKDMYILEAIYKACATGERQEIRLPQ
jgi:predicted dehydrogenase